MARGVNKVILIGNLGADPEVRYTTSGMPICTFKLATTEAWTDKQTNEKQERTEWHRVKLFGKLAEIAEKYLKKGGQVYIEGSIRTDKFTGKDGVEKYFTDIVGNNMQLLGGPGGGGGGGGNYQRNQGSGQRSSAGGGYGAPAGAPAHAEPETAADPGFTDDEIPF